MKNLLTICCSIFIYTLSSGQELDYYLPKEVQYSKTIPTPKEILHFNVGEWHVTHDKLVTYMKSVAAACPERVLLKTMGYTTEQREQVLLIISSPENIKNIEQIRTQHLLLQNGNASNSNLEKMPAIVWIGHSIHGNESSGSNAALLGAYHLAAAQGNAMDELLKNVVILYDPSFNPDGLQRFSTWANQHKSKNLVTDPNSREFNEVWPGGRFNHYWFDLNRDWLPQVHVESQNRVAFFHQWKPNVLTDHHEMGSNASFFFQPGVPSRVNPLTPKINQDLTAKIASYHATYLDKIGSLYYTKEGYDDFYYGKGSTYPDVQGCIGILFEQASSRGHAQETSNGILRFPFTIKNQFTTELSTLEAAKNLRVSLLQYQKDFFTRTPTTQQFIYGDPKDPVKSKLFTQMLLRNDIAVYPLKTDLTTPEGKFEKEVTYVVPLNQNQQQLIRAIFEKTLDYKDSIFYDITAWTFPLAFDLPYSLTTGAQAGNKIGLQDLVSNTPSIEKSNYAYIMDWDAYHAPAVLFALQQKNIITKVASQGFSAVTSNGIKKFKPGAILIPTNNQPDLDLYNLLKSTAQKYAVPVDAMSSGLSVDGIDLGSGSFNALTKPKIALLVGNGVNATDAGEVWFLLDQRMDIPATHLELNSFNRVDLEKYNTIIMAGGSYTDLNKDKLKTWVQNGGLLICTEEAIQWSANNGISEVKLKKVKPPYDSLSSIPYNQRDAINGAQQMSGAIFAATTDLSNPLAFGYNSNKINLFKGNKVYMEKSKNPFATPFYYTENPLVSGWISKQNKDAVRNCAAVLVNTLGNGRIINIDNNPNFRGFWLGGTKLFMNAVFFGRTINVGSSGGD